MFTRENKTLTNTTSLSNYIEGFDIFNSKLLYKLRDPKLSRSSYVIEKHPYRPDLIAKDFYGSVDYSDFVVLATGESGIDALSTGSTLSLVTKSELDKLINSL